MIHLKLSDLRLSEYKTQMCVTNKKTQMSNIFFYSKDS